MYLHSNVCLNQLTFILKECLFYRYRMRYDKVINILLFADNRRCECK